MLFTTRGLKAITKKVWGEMRTKGRDLRIPSFRGQRDRKSWKCGTRRAAEWRVSCRMRKRGRKEGREGQGVTGAQVNLEESWEKCGITGDLTVLWWSQRGQSSTVVQSMSPRKREQKNGDGECQQPFGGVCVAKRRKDLGRSTGRESRVKNKTGF